MVGPLCWPSVSTSRPCHTFPSVFHWLRSMSTSLTPNMPAPFPRALLTASRRRVHEHRCCEALKERTVLLVVVFSERCSALVHRLVLVGPSPRPASRAPATCCAWHRLHCVSSAFSPHHVLCVAGSLCTLTHQHAHVRSSKCSFSQCLSSFTPSRRLQWSTQCAQT